MRSFRRFRSTRYQHRARAHGVLLHVAGIGVLGDEIRDMGRRDEVDAGDGGTVLSRWACARRCRCWRTSSRRSRRCRHVDAELRDSPSPRRTARRGAEAPRYGCSELFSKPREFHRQSLNGRSAGDSCVDRPNSDRRGADARAVPAARAQSSPGAAVRRAAEP